MGNKWGPKPRKLKNRGGERLKEWKIIKEFGVVKQQSNVNTDTSSVYQNTSEHSELGCKSPCELESTNNESVGLSPIKTSCVGEDTVPVTGRRIININYFLKNLKEAGSHAPQFGCTLANMDMTFEIKRGLRSGFVFQCNMCGVKRTVWSEDSEDSSVMDINSAAVAGVISSGGGYSCLETIMGAMNIRCMNYKTFDKHQDIVASGWEKTALVEMKLAADEEISLAKQRGDVDQDGVPLLTVVADGSWAKRSYRCNYNSLSGVVSNNLIRCCDLFL